jgi:hypothetical protein
MHYLPYVTLTQEPILDEYDHVDCAGQADPEKKALFAAIAEKKNLTPSIRTEELLVKP